MARWFLSFCFVLIAPVVQAGYCTGTDLRATLSDQEQAQIARAVQTVPFAHGNHWIARRGDQTIHIIGTMHLDDPRWDPVMDQLGPIVSGVERLFVEMTDADQADMQNALSRQPEKVFITQGPTLPELLPEQEWQQLSAAMAERGVPGFIASKMQPWMQTLMLGMPACAIENPSLAKGGLDLRLMDIARDAGVPVQSLEGFEELYSVLAEGTVEEQLSILMATLPFADDSEDHFATTAGFYFDEETAAAWEFARLLSHRQLEMTPQEIEAVLAEFKSKLLDRRNQAWMRPLLTAPEARIAVAVGGLHLMGEQGVLNLLAQAGFTMERAPFRSGP